MAALGRAKALEGSGCRSYIHVWDRSRYSLLYLAGGLSEERVQAEVRQALQALGIQAWVTDAGGKGVRGRLKKILETLPIPTRFHAAILAAVQAVLPVGHSDLTGYLPDGRALFLEVKAPERVDPRTGRSLAPPGKPTREQLAFLDRAAAAGCVVGVVWANRDAIEIIQAANRAACKEA